jgi:hypothetical protein
MFEQCWNDLGLSSMRHFEVNEKPEMRTQELHTACNKWAHDSSMPRDGHFQRILLTFWKLYYMYYEGSSISKLQIQVAIYVFELSAGNCHR